MSDKTIMFYINAIHEGGAERVILQLAYHFYQSGYRAILVTSFYDKNEYPIPEGVIRISLEQEKIMQSKIIRNISRIIKLRDICKKEKPRILVSFMAEPNVRALIATMGTTVKNLISVRNDPAKEYAGILGKIISKCILPFADGCVFQTNEARTWFPKKLQNKSKIIFNDVDECFFKMNYVPSNNIVTLGRLCEQKNQKMLITAFANIARDYPDWNLLIYGDGNCKNELKEHIDFFNMADRIFLMGLTTNAQYVLANAGIFVLSSDYEGLPNALMEALAVGVPCISTDCPCGGPRSLIKDKVNGLLTPVGDVVSMENNIKFLLENREIRKQYSNAARENAESYSSEKVFLQWKSYIEYIICNK